MSRPINPWQTARFALSFHLYATVRESDKEGFEGLKTAHAHRLRDKIIFEIRNAEITDLTDPGLGGLNGAYWRKVTPYLASQSVLDRI
jgi:hypothetical protein